MTRQLDTRPSAFTRMLTPILPLLIPLAASVLCSRWGLLAIWRAGVKREKSPEPPPPGPLPDPPAPVPMPEVPAPEVDALPAPAALAAGIGEGRGSFGGGATMGEGSAFFAGAPAGFLICCGLGAGFGGGGFTGGGCGSSATPKVLKCWVVSA